MTAGVSLAKQHQKVKRLRRLVGRRSARQAEGAFVVVGATLVDVAIRSGAAVESIYVASDRRDAHADAVVAAAYDRGIRVYDLAPGVLERTAGTVTPQPLLAVVRDVTVPLETLRDASLVVVCVDVRDPGNAGTVIRSAEAAGADGVVSCGGTVDVTNPKCVRASAGSLFHVPVVAGGDTVTVLEEMGGWGLNRLAASVGKGDEYTAVDLRRPTALVLGNEARGLPPDVEALVDGALHIPMVGRAESLNVGMAAAILCFEAVRQRRATREPDGV